MANTKSASLLSLTAKACPAPPGWREDVSGNGAQQEFHVGQVVRVSCPKGQQVKGSGTISCRPDQTWSPVSSVCESMYRVLKNLFGCIVLEKETQERKEKLEFCDLDFSL